MTVIAYQTDLRKAVLEPGVKPDNPPRIYELTLKGETEADFVKLREIFDMLREDAKAAGIPITDHDEDEIADKLKAAANN